MKSISLTIIVFAALLTSCSKKEETQVPPMADTSQPAPQPQQQKMPTLSSLPPHMRSGIAAIDQNKLRTHESAAKMYLNLPDSASPIPIPPPLRPFKNLKIEFATDTTAIYTFTTANGRPGDMLLHRSIENGDTIWIPIHILPH